MIVTVELTEQELKKIRFQRAENEIFAPIDLKSTVKTHVPSKWLLVDAEYGNIWSFKDDGTLVSGGKANLFGIAKKGVKDETGKRNVRRTNRRK